MKEDWSFLKETKDIHDSWNLAKDKSSNELSVVEQLLSHLSIDAFRLVSTGVNDPPDCILQVNDVSIGIEVVGLISQPAREENAKIRKNLILDGGEPNWTKEVHYEWTKKDFQDEIERIVKEKEVKIGKSKSDSKAASDCTKFWLIVHTDEFGLNSIVVEEYLDGCHLNSLVFEKVYLILPYEPGRVDHRYSIYLLN
jgi:hypothetical protein